MCGTGKKERTHGSQANGKPAGSSKLKHHAQGRSLKVRKRFLTRLFLNNSLPFHNGQDSIHAWRGNFFLIAAGPMNLNFFHFCRRTQSEMQPQIRARCVASPADHVGALPYASGSHKNLRSDGIPRALWSANQFECEPMVAVLYNVSE